MQRGRTWLAALVLCLTVLFSTFAGVGVAILDVGAGLVCAPGTVYYLGKDTTTQGNWKGVYGSYAHILPNPPTDYLEIPIGYFTRIPEDGSLTYSDYGWTDSQIAGLLFNKTWSPYWDEYVTLSPPIRWNLTGTLLNMPGIGPIQFPTFGWTWEKNFDSSDPRAAFFEVCWPGGRKLTCWDDGSERGFPSGGYFNVTLTFPSGCFMLSLYAYDEERWARNDQTIYLTDTSGKILDSATMSGTEFDEGMYLQFVVCGPTTIVAQVKKGSSVNAVLSGIFIDKLDKLPIVSSKAPIVTVGKIKGNVGQGYAQVIPVNIENFANTTNFTVCAYHSSPGLTPIGNQSLLLHPGESGDAIINWAETSAWPKGNYPYNITINTYGNDSLIYSTFFIGSFNITIVGDLNNDSKVDILDVYIVASAFGSHLNDPRYNITADIIFNRRIDIMDVIKVTSNYGNTDP